MKLGLKDKVVGITGVGSIHGIGFAVAKEFLREGAKLFLCDLSPDSLREVKNSLGENVFVYPCDVSDQAQVEKLFKDALADLGRIDVFVNNAGIYPQSSLCDTPVELWDKVMAVNLRAVFLCCKEAAAAMKGRGGVILNASSWASLIPSAGSGAYAASKSAVSSLTKTFAAELAPYGIRVNGFIPGAIETPLTRPVIEDRREAMESQIAMHRLGTPEDVAKPVVFLASEAASYLTGAFVEISGGKLCVQNPDYGWK